MSYEHSPQHDDSTTPPNEGIVWIPGGTFTTGSDRHYPEERPTRRVDVSGFWLDRTPVTTAQFAAFVDASEYVTLAERDPDPDDYPGADPDLLVPGSAVFTQPQGPLDLRNPGDWWAYVPDANWRQSLGPDRDVSDLSDHPIVHLAYEDAVVNAEWAGRRLPTDAEHPPTSAVGGSIIRSGTRCDSYISLCPNQVA